MAGVTCGEPAVVWAGNSAGNDTDDLLRQLTLTEGLQPNSLVAALARNNGSPNKFSRIISDVFPSLRSLAIEPHFSDLAYGGAWTIILTELFPTHPSLDEMEALLDRILSAGTNVEPGFAAFEFGCSPSFEVKHGAIRAALVEEKLQTNINDEGQEIGVVCLPGIGRLSFRRMYVHLPLDSIGDAWGLFLALNRTYRLRCGEEQLSYPFKLNVHVSALTDVKSWISTVRWETCSAPLSALGLLIGLHAFTTSAR
jgi:hypothetical protein